MINGNKVGYEDSGLSKREWNELMEILEKNNLKVSN
jgi:thymidylate synthase (FAD)